MNDESQWTITRKFELLTKIGAAGLAFLYLCGFLVVMVHLSTYGVYSIALLRGQYLAAGVLSMGPICLTFFIFARLHTTFEGFPFGLLPASGWSRLKRVFQLLFIIMWEVISIFALCSFLIDGFASVFVPTVRDILFSHLKVFSWLTVQSIMLFFFAVKAWQISSNPATHDKEGVRKTFPLAICLSTSVFFFFAYLSYFARHVYAEIPFAMGGGKPQTVLFLTRRSDDGVTFPQASGQPNNRSIPYKLILETDSTYTVLPENTSENAIQFNRDAVTGYIILKDP
jgi:hypothetical protein